MNKDNKKFFLEDYSDKFDFKHNKAILKISFNRIAFIFFIFTALMFIFCVKLIYLSSLDNIEKNIKSNSEFRSTIIDRNGNILAKSVITKNIGINPKEVIDKNKLLINLRLIFPKKDFEKIKKVRKGQILLY